MPGTYRATVQYVYKNVKESAAEWYKILNVYKKYNQEVQAEKKLHMGRNRRPDTQRGPQRRKGFPWAAYGRLR